MRLLIPRKLQDVIFALNESPPDATSLPALLRSILLRLRTVTTLRFTFSSAIGATWAMILHHCSHTAVISAPASRWSR